MRARTGQEPLRTAPGQSWETCDPDVRAFVERTIAAITREVGDELVGIYLQGSLAMGSFRRGKSDVDVLVVVRQRLSAAVRRALATALADVSASRPIAGDLELSVIRAEDARAAPHPMAYEVHYSSSWVDRIRCDEVDYAADRIDPDLAAHCTVTRARGVRLVGASIDRVFGAVAWSDYLDSVLGDFDSIAAGENILTMPHYGVLNACRVLQILREGEGTVRNKEEGALWALANLPPAHHPLVERALASYRSVVSVPAAQLDSGGFAWPADALRAFRDYAADEVRRFRSMNQWADEARPA